MGAGWPAENDGVKEEKQFPGAEMVVLDVRGVGLGVSADYVDNVGAELNNGTLALGGTCCDCRAIGVDGFPADLVPKLHVQECVEVGLSAANRV